MKGRSSLQTMTALGVTLPVMQTFAGLNMKTPSDPARVLQFPQRAHRADA